MDVRFLCAELVRHASTQGIEQLGSGCEGDVDAQTRRCLDVSAEALVADPRWPVETEIDAIVDNGR